LDIVLAVEPPLLDPTLVYDVDAWSVTHSIFDSLVAYDADGKLVPQLAESWSQLDPLTLEFTLRPNVTFHNGEPFDARSVAFSIAHMQSPETASQVAQNFAAIERVEEVEPLTVRLILSEPAPYLLAQIALYLGMLPPEYASDPANDITSAPIGTGPYRFVSWERGQRLTVERNPDYSLTALGTPMAEQVTFRFIADDSTRVSELRAGTADIIRNVPQDQESILTGEDGSVVSALTSQIVMARLANDVEPLTDARVRQALNYAVDVDAIIEALLGGHGERIATVLVPTSIGYDPDLDPFPYDPDRARELLTEAGYGDGFSLTLDVTADAGTEVPEAIAGMLAEVGIQVTIQRIELARFNESWADPSSGQLRMFSWSPMFDPYSLLGLVFGSDGYLSRFSSPEADALITQAGVETDPEARAELYRQLGQRLHADPAVIYLWAPEALYGVSADASRWTPRPDQLILPLSVTTEGA
jgi:peptide/nickel transport system substrate-binding protein